MINSLFRVLFFLSVISPAPMALAQIFDIPRSESEARAEDPGGQAETVELRIEGQVRQISFVTDANGMAVYQGDIVLGEASDIRNLAQSGQLTLQEIGDSDTELFGLVATRKSAIWPSGRVPFRIDASVPNAWLPRIRQAIRHWEENTQIRFEERQNPQGPHVVFFDDPETESCQTSIGRPLLGERRIQLAGWCQWGNIVHEIAHVLGMHHEHARSDSALFIDVIFSDGAPAITRQQFEADPASFADMGPYCYDSIVHYGKTNAARTFRIRAKAEPLGDWTGNRANMGQRRTLADCDIATINALYDFETLDDAAEAPPPGFVGELAFRPDGCEGSRRCFLVNDVRYNARNGLGWQASKRADDAGDMVESGVTDGASIPLWAQPLIGEPFDPEFIKPAVIHDHYSYPENRVRKWWATQRVFYEMLRDEGISQAKARIMYLGVLVGSRKWILLVPGDDCGPNCINDIGDAANVNSTSVGGVFREWEATYDTKEYDEAMRLGMAALALYGDEMTIDDVNVLAGSLLPEHPIFKVGDVYAPTGLQDAFILD